MSDLTQSQLAAFQWLDTPMWAYDLGQRRMVWANPAGLRLWKAASLDEFVSRDFSDLSETATTRVRVAMAEHAAGRTTREVWNVYPANEPITITAHSHGLRLDDGTTAVLYEAHVATEPLDPAVLRGVEAMQHTSVRVMLFTPDGRLLMRNPAAVRAFGEGLADGQPGALARLFADRAEVETLYRTIGLDETFSVQTQLRTPEGAVWHGLDARRVRDPADGRDAILLNARDISVLKQAEEVLRTAKETAEEASIAKSVFLATMSHEIRTPLNGVLGLAELLMEPGIGEADRRAFARTIFESGQTLLTLLNDILDLSKIEAGHLQLESTPFAVAPLLDDMQRLFGDTAQKKGLILSAQWCGAVARDYVGDPTRIRQMLSNLVSNALKFTARGAVRIEAEEVAGGADWAELLFSVTDSGVGIAPEQQARLFQRFSQGDSSTTRQYGGTGLGLSIVRNLAEAMSGGVGVDSQPGQGARFWFRVRVVARG